MSIHKTKSGKYEVRWRDKGRQRSKTFQRKIDASKFEAKVQLNQLPDYLKDKKEEKLENITFRELSEIWIRDHSEVHNAPSTVLRNKQILRSYLLPSLGKYPIDSIEKRDIIQLQARLRRTNKLSAKTINNILGLANKIFSDGLSWGFVDANPAAAIKRIKAQDKEHVFWEFDERDRFLNFARSRHPVIHDIVLFTVNTGLRKGEVEGLLRDCVDYERREIIVKRNFCHKTSSLNEYTKGKSVKRVPMNQAVWDLMQEHRLKAPSQKIFDFDFEHMVWRHFKPLQEKAGVKVITFHDLRHTFASHLAMSAVSLFDIQKLLGHSDLKTTQRYMHLAPDHLQGVTDVLVRGKPKKHSGDAMRSFSSASG